ncbi:MAG: FecR domain-containing protein [Bacteroidota bacterium]
METPAEYFNELITKYFCGEASAGEINTLEQWVKTDPANRNVFEEYGKTWSALEKSKINATLNLDREWQTLQSKTSGIRPSASGIRFRTLRLPRIAALFLLLAVPAFLLYRYLSRTVEKKCSAPQEVTCCTLPDGTVVTLNTGATLVYPSHFSDSLRTVTLTGEAWFEVSPDKVKPFIIAAENVRIRVLGTSFLVNTMTSDDTKEIILSSGKVMVYYENRPDKNATLSPGEKAEAITDGYVILKEKNTNMNWLSWKTRRMVFDNTPLTEVAVLLAKVYHTPVSVTEESLNNCRITATFDNQSLESVLNVLKATLDLQIRKSGAGIEISGHGCR